MSIIMFLNLKGGVAKTTTAMAVAECLATQGYRTLVIDADHQMMAGELLLGETRLLKTQRDKRTLYHLLTSMLADDFDSETIGSYVARKVSNINGGLANLSVLPCSLLIDNISTNQAKARREHQSTDEFLAVLTKRRAVFRKWLQTNFDFTIVDCPPHLALQVKFVLPIADNYIIPSIPDRLSIRGSLLLVDRLWKDKLKTRPLGTLWTMYRKQNAMHEKYVAMEPHAFHPQITLPEPFNTIIPNATKIGEATEDDRRPTSFRSKYSTEIAKLFEDLCEEIVQRSAWVDSAQKKKQPSAR